MEDLTFPTLRSLPTIWSCRLHRVINFWRSWILSIGPVGFLPTMAYIVAMVYFTMAAWWFCGCRERPLGTNIGISHSILWVSQSDGGSCMVLLYCSWRLKACIDNSGRGPCQSLCLAVFMTDLEVLEGLLQNQRLLVIISFVNLWTIGSV